jgi:hypothetical protein
VATRNTFEQSVEKQLKQSKVMFSYETEAIDYLLQFEYIPDFIIDKKTEKIYIECKGYLQPSDRRKMIAVKKQHPDLDIRIIFQRDNWLTKKKKQRYSDWAEKNGFKWAIAEIPKEWLTDANKKKTKKGTR